MIKMIKKTKTKKGLTLVEVLIALLLFSFLASISAGIFVNFYGNYYKSKVVQQNLEDADYAMSYMAKILRTSTLLDDNYGEISSNGANWLIVYDNSQRKCYKFNFNNARLYVTETGAVLDSDTCGAALGASNERLLSRSETLNGWFRFLHKSDKNDANWKVGMIMIDMRLLNANTNDKVRLQTTVSLRDYSQLE